MQQRFKTLDEYIIENTVSDSKNEMNEAYMTSHIVPGYEMTINDKHGFVTEILQQQNETVYEIAFKADDEKIYNARFNGHMFIITKEILPEPGI